MSNMSNKYVKSLNDNEIIILDNTEKSKKSIIIKHITSMLDHLKSQQGYYSSMLNLEVQYDNVKYVVNTTDDSYIINSSPIDRTDIEIQSLPKTITLLRGQRYTLPIDTEYCHLKYTHDSWFKTNKNTITPIEVGLHTLCVNINNIEYIIDFIIVEQPPFITDVNAPTKEAWQDKQVDASINVPIETLCDIVISAESKEV